MTLPDAVRDELLARWREPHRRYHGESHLRFGLAVLDELGAGDLERIAFWCHDAVHTNTTPDDERASATLTRQLLAGHLAEADLREVERLVLLTATHPPRPGDARGRGTRVAPSRCRGSPSSPCVRVGAP